MNEDGESSVIEIIVGLIFWIVIIVIIYNIWSDKGMLINLPFEINAEMLLNEMSESIAWMFQGPLLDTALKLGSAVGLFVNIFKVLSWKDKDTGEYGIVIILSLIFWIAAIYLIYNFLYG